MISIPTEICLVPQTWCTITDVEVQKCSGKISINKMRLIQLIQPEFQKKQQTGWKKGTGKQGNMQ